MNDAGERKIELVRGLHEAVEEIGTGVIRDALVASRDMADLATRLGAFGEFVVELVDPDVEVELTASRFSLPDMPSGTTLRGWDGWMAFWRGWLEPWESFRYEIGNFAVFGDHVVLDIEVHGLGREGGVPFETSGHQVWTVRNGKIAGLAIVETRAEALARAREGGGE